MSPVPKVNLKFGFNRSQQLSLKRSVNEVEESSNINKKQKVGEDDYNEDSSGTEDILNECDNEIEFLGEVIIGNTKSNEDVNEDAKAFLKEDAKTLPKKDAEALLKEEQMDNEDNAEEEDELDEFTDIDYSELELDLDQGPELEPEPDPGCW